MRARARTRARQRTSKVTSWGAGRVCGVLVACFLVWSCEHATVTRNSHMHMDAYGAVQDTTLRKSTNHFRASWFTQESSAGDSARPIRNTCHKAGVKVMLGSGLGLGNQCSSPHPHPQASAATPEQAPGEVVRRTQSPAMRRPWMSPVRSLVEPA